MKYSKGEEIEWARSNLVGHWSTLVTPFDSEDAIDRVGLIRNIERIRNLGTNGIGCTWGMGEFWSLTNSERKHVMEIVSDYGNDMLIGTHITHTSFKEMINFAEFAEDLGFDILIVGAPYFAARKDEHVEQFLKIIAESTNMAIMFYNSPQFGIVLGAESLNRICQIPGVIGVKEASFDRNISIKSHQLIGEKSIISTPDEWILFEGARLGFCQQVMFANTSDWRFGKPGNNYYVEFINEATKGKINEERYNLEIKPVKLLSDEWWMKTVKQSGGVIPVSLCKYWGELLGMAGGHVRAPVDNFSSSDRSALKEDLVKMGVC
jgi:dihydrodipicolinate synthase/N-acetylneuraminate lyase